MKTSSLLKKSILALGCLYCLQIPTIFAGYFVPATPDVLEVNAHVLDFDSLKHYTTDLYNDMIKAVADLIYEFDQALPKTIAQNTQLNKTQQTVADNIMTKLNAAVSFGLADTITQQSSTSDLITNTHLEDDITVPLKVPSTSIFESSNDTYVINNDLVKANKEKNAILNINTLLAPYQYTTTQDKNALLYINYLENLTPFPPVIRISNVFSVPTPNPKKAMDDPNATETITLDGNKTVDKDSKGHEIKNTVENLISHLNQDPKYQNYKLTYRSMIAARTLFLSNLLRSYQSRVSLNNGASAAQLEYDEASKRLSPDYYQAMAKASPAVIQRETLFLLAQIHRDIYEMRQDSERLMIMESISGLQTSGISNVMLTQAVKDISKNIYCWAKPEDENTCKSPAAIVSSPEVTGAQQQ